MTRQQIEAETEARNVYRLQVALSEVCDALRQCRDQFSFYAEEHEKAGKFEKSRTNRRFVKIASDALEHRCEHRKDRDEG